LCSEYIISYSSCCVLVEICSPGHCATHVSHELQYTLVVRLPTWTMIVYRSKRLSITRNWWMSDKWSTEELNPALRPEKPTSVLPRGPVDRMLPERFELSSQARKAHRIARGVCPLPQGSANGKRWNRTIESYIFSVVRLPTASAFPPYSSAVVGLRQARDLHPQPRRDRARCFYYTSSARLELLFFRSLQTGPFCSQTPLGRHPKLDDYRRGWLVPDYFSDAERLAA
jgi:hypothetical protein